MKKIILLVVLAGICLTTFSQNANFIITGSSLKLINTGGVKLLLHNTNFENNAADSSVQGDSELILTGSNEITMGGLFANSFHNLQIDKLGSAVILGHHLNISNQLTLNSGNVDIGSNNLNLGTGNLVGGSDSSYIKTSGSGVMKRYLTRGDQIFPVGNASYNPAVLTNTNSSSDTFNIRVMDNVTQDGSGLGFTLPFPFVKRSWSVGTSKTGGDNNVSIRLHWDKEQEMNGFTNAVSFMVRHDGANWEKLGSILGNAFDKNSHTVKGISHFSTFSISSHSELISNILQRINKVYPNPFTSSFTIEIASKLEERAKLRLYSISGNLVAESTMELKIGLNPIQMKNLDHLQPDNYILMVETNQQLFSKRIVKLL